MTTMRNSDSPTLDRHVGLSCLRMHTAVVLMCAIVFAIVSRPVALEAADDTAEGPLGSIRRAYVPADQPQSWPEGRWIARPVDEFRQLLVERNERELEPPRATLNRVTYAATLSGMSFTEGKLTANVGLRGSVAKYLSLGQPTISLSGLSWRDRPAVWGTDPEGAMLLRVDSDGSQLQGNWSLRGRDVLGDIAFDAILPPAVISRLELQIPTSKHLEVSNGIVAISLPGDDPEWRRWVLDLGRETRLQFLVTDASQPSTPPKFVVQRMSRYSLLPEELQFHTNFAIDILGGTVRQLTFGMPPGIDVSSVVLGSDVELPFRHVVDAGQSMLVVPLRSNSLSGRTSISVRGTVPLPAEATWTLPRLSCLQAHVSSSRMNVTVHRPLELADFSTTRCRLIASTMNRNQTDSLELEDWSDTSELTVTLDIPQADVVSDVLSVVSAGMSQPTIRSLLKLTTLSGSVYQLPCRVPAGWQITRVTSVPRRRPDSIAQWHTVPDGEGASLLHLEFRDALTPERTLLVEVRGRRVADPMSLSMEMPVIRLASSASRSVTVMVYPAPHQTASIPEDSPYKQQSTEDAAADWRHDIEWDRWLADTIAPESTLSQPVTFVTTAAGDEDILLLTSHHEPVASFKTDRKTLDPDQTAHPTSAVVATPEDDRPPPSQTIMADVTVYTQVPEAAGQETVQIVRYSLPQSAAGSTLEFELPEPATLIAALVNGVGEQAILTDRSARIPLPSEGDRFDIELEYRLPFSQSLLRGSGEIPLPKSSLAVAQLEWRLLLPPSFQMSPTTTGTSFEQSTIGWRQRFLGPLGRESKAVTLLLAGGADRDSHGHATTERVQAAPSGTGRIHMRTVPFTATVLRLETWREDVSRRVGWVLLVAACMTIGLIRRVHPPHCTRMISWTVVTAGLIAMLVPDSLAVPCGGMLFGTLIGALLPQRLWEYGRQPQASGADSTRSIPLVAGAATALLLITCGLSAVAHALQQSPSTTSLASTNEATDAEGGSPAFDILIPVRSETPTLDETSVVYVRPELLDRWMSYRRSQLSPPAYLLREAEYTVTFDQRPFPRMTAVFDVIVLDHAAARQILLPLDGIAIEGDGACSVNGLAATVMPLRTGKGVAVDVTSVTQAPLPETVADSREDGSSLPGDADPARVLRIKIQCRLRIPDGTDPHLVDISVPRLLAANAVLQSEVMDVDRLIVRGFGSQTFDPDNRRTSVDLGPVNSLSVHRQTEDGHAIESVFVPNSAMSSVLIYPQRLHVDTRLRFLINSSTDTRSSHALEVRLPPDSHVNDIRAPGLTTWDVRQRGEDPVAVRLLFTDPLQTDSLVVEIEYDLPADGSSNQTTIPAFQFLTQQQPDDFSVHSLALIASPGFRIEHDPLVIQSSHVRRLPPEQFTEDWLDEAIVDPDLVFSLSVPEPLDVTVKPITPTLDATVIQTLTAGRSQWQWQADVELDCQAAPVAAHHLDVDPRLQITDVSVTQDGADRLARWSRTSKRQLTLLLSSEMTGTQSIQLAGYLPYKRGELVELPEFNVPKARSRQQALVLQDRPDGTFDLFDQQDLPWPLSSEPEGEPSATGERTLGEQTIDLLAADRPAKIRMTETVSTFAFERIVALEAAAEGQWQITTQVLLPEGALLPPQIEIILPADFADEAKTSMSFDPAERVTQDDGKTRMTVPTDMLELSSRRLTMTATITSPTNRAWQIPKIDLPQGNSRREWLILPAELPYELEEGQQVTGLDDNFRDRVLLPPQADEAGLRVFRSTDADWTLIPRAIAGAGGHVRRLDSAIWDVGSEGFACVTLAQVSGRVIDELIFQLNPEVTLQHVRWNDQPAVIQRDHATNTLIISTPKREIGQEESGRLVLWWTVPGNMLRMRYSIPVPHPLEVPVISESVAFLGSDRSRYELTDQLIPVQTDMMVSGTDVPGSTISPIAAAIRAAGYTSAVGSLSGSAETIFVGRFDADLTDERATSVTVWALSRQLRRVLLVLLISAIALLIAWKTRPHMALRHQWANLNRSLFAGPTVLAGLLWVLSPTATAFGLMLLSGIAWGISSWQAYQHATTFEYTPMTPR